jgi:hypothetical protein
LRVHKTLTRLLTITFILSGCQPSATNQKAQSADCTFADVDFADLAADRPTDDDFWVVSAPEVQGLNGKILAQGMPLLEETPGLYSRLVVRHGEIVFEEYFNDAGVDKSSNIFQENQAEQSAVGYPGTTGSGVYRGKKNRPPFFVYRGAVHFENSALHLISV